MKMIKPIVNISKIMENYDTFVLGFNGVLSDGSGIYPEAASVPLNLHRAGKNLILLSNTPLRVAALAQQLTDAGIAPEIFHCIMTAGEVLHYKLKAKAGEFAAIGERYFQLGSPTDDGVFAGLDYQRVQSLESAHFLYMSAPAEASDTLDRYLPELEHAAALGLPFICAGNDTSAYTGGKIALAPAALAEQYAVIGGRILTLGKPDITLLRYCLDGLEEAGVLLAVGDNAATDIKLAELAGIDSILISKGVHINFLGEGYIPDVAKTRELSNSYDASPNYVISNLRW